MMIKFLFCSVLMSFFFVTSIYTIDIKSIDNANIPMGTFAGKKILIVNTASNSEYVNQYKGLDSLWQLYKDSLVILAFPSNSFGNEPTDNAAIKDFVMNTYNIHYTLCNRVDVMGNTKSPLYRWLALPTENGRINGKVKEDFQKFLIDGTGNVVGMFDATVQPMSAAIRNAIEQ